MPLTKRMTEFKPAKIKSYAHWTIEDWSEIQRLAAEMKVPNHWIILATAKFATRGGTKLEFSNRLPDLIKEVRAEMGFPEYTTGQIGTDRRTLILKQKYPKGNPALMCVYCFAGFSTAYHREKHESKCEKRPLEVLISN